MSLDPWGGDLRQQHQNKLPRSIPCFCMEFRMSSLRTNTPIVGKDPLRMPQLTVAGSVPMPMHVANCNTCQSIETKILDFVRFCPTIEVKPCRLVSVRHVHITTSPNVIVFHKKYECTSCNPQSIAQVHRMHAAKADVGGVEVDNPHQPTSTTYI